MPIPDLSNKPGPGRPGWGPIGSYDFQFEVTGAVTIEAFPHTAGQSFTIKWQDGTSTQTTGSSTINSPAGAGVISINNELDNTYADEFKIVSGQANVTKVISWGKNPWSIVEEAFKDCVNLTDISTTSFIAGTANRSNQASGCIMGKMFLGCTSLLEVDIRTWDLSTNGASWRLGGPFANLANLQKLDATGLKIKFFDSNNVSTSNFAGIGTNVADGCEFKMAGLDLSTSSTGYLDSLFSGTKFKGGSNLSNWKFPVNFSPGGWRGNGWFSSCILNDGILDISGWTTWPGLNVPGFGSFNSALTSQGTGRIDLSNLGLTNASDFSYMFYYCQIKEIIGLNTWGACAGNANMFRMFMGATLMRINPNDNFSDTFIASSSPTNLSNAFNNFGNGLLDSERGVAMNFNNIDFSNAPSFDSTWRFAKLLDAPNFSTATFDNNNTISFPTTFRSFNALNVDSSFVLNGGKVTSFSNTFYAATINTININDGVDLSALTYVGAMFYYANVTTATLPSNADYSSLTGFSIWITGFNGFSVCQGDILMRRLKATNLNTNITAILPKITESPALVNSDRDVLENDRGWNITTPTPDATLPFAYASYAVDPTGITTISPTVTPPAGSVFTATNGLSISASGVITIGSFRGGSTIRCTYPDGCYNEVQIVIQVPFVMRTIIPANNTTGMEIKPQMSAGECFIDWGDNNSQILTGNTTHVYTNSASDQTYDIKIFDSPSGSKFTGFTGTWAGGYGQAAQAANYDKTILQWGEIEWQNNSWFLGPANTYPNYDQPLRLAAPNGSAHKPNLSQVTSLENLFKVPVNGDRNDQFEDVNNNLADWDVSTITNMKHSFSIGRAPANRPSDGQPNILQLSNWDVSNVTDFYGFARGGFYNGNGNHTNNMGVNMTGWDTSNAETMGYMLNCRGTRTGVENFNTSKVTDMSNMFNSSTPGNIDFKTKLVNGTVRWSVKKVTDFTQMFAGNYIDGGSSFTDSTFPTNWWISGEGQDVNMSAMFGIGQYNQGRFGSLTDMDAFATKTIASGNSPYGSSYTAWDMSKVTNLANWGYSGNTQMSGKNFNISSWQISNKTTTLDSLFRTYDNANISYSMDQDIGHWDITNVTAIGSWMENTRSGFSGEVNFSTANLDSMYDITNGWGQHAGSAQSGVSLNMGTSQYTAGNVVYVTWNANTGPGTSNKLFATGFNLQAATSVGDIIYYPNSIGRTEFARITGYDNANTATTTATNWGQMGSNQDFQIFDSNAAKGRFALLEAGWTITDSGAYIPFDSTELEIEVQTVGDTMRLQFQSGTTNTHVDWGDGAGFVAVNSNIADSPGYSSTGTKTIKINQTSADSFPGFNFAPVANAQKLMLTKIKKWGTNAYTSWYRAFYGCSNLTNIDDTAAPNLTSTSSLSWAFSLMQGLTTFDFSNWSFPTSLTNLSNMFWRGNVISNTSFNTITGWDVSNIQNFAGIFTDCRLMNANISSWDTSSATNMSYMFSGAYDFNQNISEWKTSNVTSLAAMFNSAHAFNQDINTKVVGSGASAYIAWDTSNNTTWNGMFMNAQAFNTSIDKWEIAQVSDNQGMCHMFGRTSIFNQNLLTKDVTIGTGTPVAKTYVAWDVSYIQTFGIGYNSPSIPTHHGMFEGNTSFNGDISNWDIASTNARSDGKLFNRMFTSATAFNKDLSQKAITNVTGKGNYNAWNVSSVKELNATFQSASSFDQNLSNWQLKSDATIFHNLFRSTAMSTNNYTDTVVGWANYVKNQNPDAPLNIAMVGQNGMTFDSNRSGGSNFANAFAAREFLTNTTASGGAGWTITSDTILPLLISSTNSLSFNGSTEHVATTFTATGLTAMTISAYVYLDEEWESRGAITGSNWAPNDMFGFHINSDRKLDVFIRNGGANPQYLTANTAMSLGQWHHVAMTVSNNGTNNDITFYLNGSVDNTTGSTQAYGQGQNFSATTATPYNIANINQVSSQTNFSHFKGRMDEVMIWDNVISSSNITTLANAVGSGNVPDPNALASGVQLWNRMGD